MNFEVKGRPTWVELDLDILSSNFHSIKNFINHPLKYMAVVKADAYGHGAVECAKKLEAVGIDWFGVALPEEGLKLRENGINKPILCLGGFWEGQEELILRKSLTPVVYSIENALSLNKAAKKLNLTAQAHIKIDTGMGRIGVRFDDLEKFADQLKNLEYIKYEGIMTHFAAADSIAEKEFTNLQILRFNESVKIFEKRGFKFIYKDLANSPASLAYPESYGNMVRLGGILYGLGNDILPDWVERPTIKPVLSLISKIAYLKKVKKGETLGYSRTFQVKRDSTIATIPIGYEDGYKRALSNCGRVIINNQFADVVGRISMDWTIVDVSDIPNVRMGDEVILIGERDGLKITAEELAQKTDTISYEITCGINQRVTRKYVKSK